MATVTSTATPVTTTSGKKLGFDTLPVEVRYMIYRCIFPGFREKVNVNVFWDYDKLRRGAIPGRDTYWSAIIPHGSPNVGDMPVLQVQLSSASALMSINHCIRQQVAPMVYSNASFLWNNNNETLQHMGHLGPWVKSFIADIWIKMPSKRDCSPTRKELCDMMKGLGGLRDLHISHCDKTADEATTGVSWKSHNLQAMKAFRKTSPQLSHSYYVEETTYTWLIVHLSSKLSEQVDMIQFDIDGEYEAWLDLFRKRRVARLSGQSSG